MPSAAADRTPTEYRLKVRSDGDRLSGCWDGGNDFPLDLPLAKADLDELAWYLERYIEFPGAGDRARAERLERRLADWGRDLWLALFPSGERDGLYGEIRDALDRGERCLLTLAGDDPAFLIRPWEMLRDPRGPLALRGLTLRRRLLGHHGPAVAPPAADRLRLLLIVSRPEGTGFIDPRTSTRPVLDAIAPLGERVAVDFCEPPTLAELERRLAAARRAGTPYQIVHFDGHGQYYPLTGVGALCFEDAAGDTEEIPGPRLGDLLSRLRVPLVLLEACRGAQVSDRPVFGAVAPALLGSGVDSVVAFSHSVHVAAARLAVERLYRELVAGMSVGAALEEARSALNADRHRWLTLGPDPETIELQDWIIPQLYQGGADPVLVPAGAALPDSDQPPEPLPLPGFPPAPRYGFQGRARELLALERALQRHPAVLLHAGGGMGKTALAREAAHWWRRTGRFEQALFQSLEHGAGAEDVVRLIGEALGGPDFASRDPETQWSEAVRLFRRHRVLLVWDNYESILPAFSGGAGDKAPDQASSLANALDAPARADLERLYRELTGGDAPPRAGGRLLVTCRPRDAGLAGIRELRLRGLARPDALHLLRGIVERREIRLERPGYEREAIDALLDRIEDHPLSIELIAPHLQDLTPGTIRAELAERLDQFQDPGQAEGRNRSLLASLDFSRRRLGPAAREALPWLGWFEGGVFERFFLAFSRIPEPDWAGIRAELAATALVRVEDLGLQVDNRPYLKLHPTLADAAAPDLDDAGLAGRFIDCYLDVGRMIFQALLGSQPAAGMALMALEQPNLRRAMTLAFDGGRHREAGGLAETLGLYLQMAGRLRERDRLLDWVRGRMPEDRLDGTTCGAILEHAWSLSAQGRAQEALDAVLGLERRIEAGGLHEGDPRFQLALTRVYRGRILYSAGRPDLALEPQQQAVDALRTLGDDQQGNLSTALGDLANALMALGHYDQALATGDEGLAIERALGRDREVVAGLGQTAAILRAVGRHAEAESRYREALEAAEQAGDLGLQGLTRQHLGALQQQTDRTAESVDSLRQALRLFQQSGDQGNEMRTCDLLGTSERDLGRLDPAEAWYRKALTLADGLGDRRQVAITRQNLGVLQQVRAEAATAPAERDRLLLAAIGEIEASLAIEQEMGNRLGEAGSRSQLGVLHRLRGDLDRAELEARQGLAIRESLDHPDTWRDYASLAEIAGARGDAEAANRWQAKADAKRAELHRLANQRDPDAADGPPAPDRQLVDALLALAQSVHATRTRGLPPEPDTAEALARLAALPAPLGPLGTWLQAVAAGEDPPPPPGLPEPLAELATALQDALRPG